MAQFQDGRVRLSHHLYGVFGPACASIQPQKAMRICMIEAANEAIDLETSEGLENAE
jgi:hypothetical protein